MNWVASDVVAEFVRLAVRYTAVDTTASHPHAVTSRMMVAAVVIFSQCALAVDRASKLASPDDECVIKQAATLQILDEGPSWLVDFLGLPANVRRQATMVIPAAVKDLNKTHAPLGHPSSQETVVAKSPGLRYIFAVEIKHVLRFGGDVDQLRYGRLHSKGHLVLRDPRLCLRVAKGIINPAIHRLQPIEHQAASFLADTVRVREIQHRIALCAEGNPRVDRW